jgi:hypothetical protein
MADSRAYVFKINPNSTGPDEHNLVHQTSPAWVLTFVRWSNRDTLRTTGTPYTDVRLPLVVENDCVQVTTSMNKGSMTPSMNAVLVMTDVNYETSVAPGDFVFVNMLNWEKDARRVANAARNQQAINGLTDGFKGLFKVQSVRKTLAVDPGTGTKTVIFKISGFAFTEFNNTIYFNPYMLDPNQDPKNLLLFSSYIGKDWSHLINQKGLTNVQDIVAVLIQSFIGSGVNDQGRKDKLGNVISPNVHFFVPSLVGTYLGISNAKSASDIYTYMFGIQNYAGGTSIGIVAGMNPNGAYINSDRFYYTPLKVQGDSFLKPEYWNQVKTWSILNQYINAPLNEIYTCFRISPNGRVMPTLVLRQIPFTTEDFTATSGVNTSSASQAPNSINSSTAPTVNVTRFMNLPRWKVDPALILDLDIGREEAARINFVQFFGKTTINSKGTEISNEIAQGNYAYDVDDVQRSGLRPYIITTQFDEPTDAYKEYRSPTWAKIIGDALIGGHLKMNGSITCVGLIDPITVGDNLELDGTVYHIEEVTHVSSIDINGGSKSFRTILSISSGVNKSSSTAGTRYSEMTYTKAQDLRDNDYKNNQLLPGVSESQDTVYRSINPDIDNPGDSTANGPFVQPNNRKGAQSNSSDSGNDT